MSKPTTERETCPACGLPYAAAKQDPFRDAVCKNWTQLGRDVCMRNTIVRLRAALAEATKLREAVDAVEAVYQTPESDAHDVVAGYEQHVRALLRAEAKNG